MRSHAAHASIRVLHTAHRTPISAATNSSIKLHIENPVRAGITSEQGKGIFIGFVNFGGSETSQL
jgi:hypothetical protein